MILITIYISMLICNHITMYKVDLVNQTSKCVTWVEKHVHDNTEFHDDEKDDSIYINIDYFNQGSIDRSR